MRTAQGENTMKHTKNTKSFASRWGFILASVGSAVGMANVWGFPNKMGSNGGGAFLLIYLLFVFIFSYVGLPAEFAMGRRAATGTLGAYENAWATRGRSAGKAGGLLGWLPLAGSMCIAIGYAVIVTYILKALADSLLGTLMTADTAAWFGAFSGTPYSVIPYHIVVVVGTLLTLFLGAHSIEKTNKVMMPLFFLIFLVLAVRVALLPNAAEGYLFMFTPRWEALTDPMIWIWAMGQAFFSLSVTGSGMIVYGAYLSKDEDVVDVAQHTALFDTIAAVVAALVIIPACFSYGLDVGAGPSLLFVTLPTILQDIPLGRLFAIILYVAMIFAGVSSLQNMFEAVAESLMHKFPRLSRTAVLVILCVVCLGFGIGMETIDKWGPWMDLVSIYIIPIGATLGAISWFYVMKKDELLDAVNTGSGKLQNMFEAVAESLMHKFPRLSRTAVLVILCVVCLGFGIGMETIDKWGPWMDLVSIYIIPIGATLGAISWFYVMKKDELLDAVNTGSGKLRGNLWYSVGRYVYVPLAVILCCVALFMHVAF